MNTGPYKIVAFDDYIASRDEHTASWVQLAPQIERPVISPTFLLGDWPAELSYGFYNETRIGPVRCYTLRDVSLVADGIVLAGDSALSTTLLNHPSYHVEAVVARREEAGLTQTRRVSGAVVMLSGPGSHIYGHWLVDILPRLHVLTNCGHDLSKLMYAVPSGLPEFCRVYLDLLGISRSQLIEYDGETETLEVDYLLLPTNLRSGSQIHPMIVDAVRLMRTRILGNAAALGALERGRRLFVSRRRGEPSRTLSNREQIETAAIAAGFEIVMPEVMSIPEQVALFTSAAEIAGEYGSGLHGSVFAPSGTVITALRGTSHHPGFIQSGLGQAFRQPTGYVLTATPISAVDQSFQASEDAFRQALRFSALIRKDSDDRR